MFIGSKSLKTSEFEYHVEGMLISNQDTIRKDDEFIKIKIDVID